LLTALTLAFAATSAQAAAPDFTWSTAVSTAQAGGHPNLTFNYASASTQSLTRLDVDLPPGLMHRINLTGACTNAQYLADTCPASSTVGTVAAQVVVARTTVAVPGTIYQLSEAAAGSDATFGIVLRPPLSNLGFTGKIFVRNHISFTNGGGLRSSLVGPLSSVTILGNSVASRISQLKLVYNSQTPTGNVALVSNPTGCKAQTFTALGTYSDASTKSKTSSFSTTGCPAVPFAPTAAIQIDNNTAGQRTTFSALLGNAGSGSSSALHFGHVVAIGHDFDQLGDFDFQQIDSGVLCTDAQAASTAGCPAASEIGDLSGEVEGFGAVTGKTYATNSPGHKTVNEITLRRIKVRFPGGLGGDNDSTISFTGMPQVPLTSFRFKATKPILRLTNTCAIRISRTTSRSFGDGVNVNQNSIAAPACPPPAAPQITAGPDRGITINTSHVEYRFISPETGVSFECKKNAGPFFPCASPWSDDWADEGVNAFSVRALRGGVAGPATTATFTIDTMGPVVTLTNPDDQDADKNGIADQPFRAEDFVVDIDLGDATSGVNWDKLDVSFQSDSDPAATRTLPPTRPHTQGHVQVGGAAISAPPGGPGTITVTAYDLAGHVTVLKLGVIIDTSQPTIVNNEKKTVFTDAPKLEYPFEASDDSLRYPQGEMTFECYRKGWDGTVKGGSKKIITDRDTGRTKGVCVFEDLPEGSFKVTVRGWDPVKKEAIAEGDLIVDRSAPIIVLPSSDDADLDADGVADNRFRPSFFDVFTELSDLESGIDPNGTSCVAKVVNKGAIKGAINVINANRVTCSLGGLPDGDVEVEITAKNYVGTVTIVKRGFTVDTTPPEITVNGGDTLFTDARDVEVPFEASDASLRYPQGELTTECYRKGWDGTVKGGSKIITDRDTGRSKGFCSFADVPEGSFKVTVRGWDPVKKEAIAEGNFVVDRTAPQITLTNPEDADDDNDGVADKRFRPSFFDVFTEITDLESGIDPSGTSCVAKVKNKGAIKGNVTINNANRVTCTVEGLPDGDVDVEITAKNYVGTVTIVKRGFTVDTTPPTMTFSDAGDLDTDGDGFSDNRVRAARLGYAVWVDDARGIGVDPNSGGCTATNRKGGKITGSVVINNGSLRCSFEGLPDGDTDIEISVADYRGHVTVLKSAVTIDAGATEAPIERSS
jgi:hypothetical protein